MTNRDYSQLEINNIIAELLGVHYGKLKDEELKFLHDISFVKITQGQRDVLIKLYDAVGENSLSGT